ncbi:MAG: hypothetical protein M1826_007250 [Phylliscum demangeonii]|nr:MAG: hypothetical protein M1826_007250 [Phylliscum demangeonii]
MGKRKKAARKPQGGAAKKKAGVIPKHFKCLFCNHESSIVIKVEKRTGVGNLTCKVCGQMFQSAATYLTEPIDVYSDWIDACESVRTQQPSERFQRMPLSHPDPADIPMPSRELDGDGAAGSEEEILDDLPELAPGGFLAHDAPGEEVSGED